MKRDTMSVVGEKAFLATVLPKLPAHPNFVNGFGDDCAFVDIGGTQQLVTKIDRAASPIATKNGWTGYDMWGRLAATATCSDLLASGAHPLAIMLAMILPPDFASSDAEDIIMGCADECAAHGVAFVGGDTKEGPYPEVVTAGYGLASLGETHGRSGALPGDLLVVAGKLGGYLGAYLQMLACERENQSEAARWDSWLDYVTHPTARWVEAERLRPLQIAKAAMDCSDGLYDALDGLRGSWTARIEESRLPIHPFAKEAGVNLGLNPTTLALGVGDWNILYVISREHASVIDDLARTVDVRVIGQIADLGSDVLMVDPNGNERPLRRVVNEHFVARQEDQNTLEWASDSPYQDG